MSDRGVDIDQRSIGVVNVETDPILSMKAMWQDGLRRYEAGDYQTQEDVFKGFFENYAVLDLEVKKRVFKEVSTEVVTHSVEEGDFPLLTANFLFRVLVKLLNLEETKVCTAMAGEFIDVWLDLHADKLPLDWANRRSLAGDISAYVDSALDIITR